VAASMALGEVIAVIASLIRVNRIRGDSAFSNFSYLIFSFVVMGCLLLTTVTLGDIGYIYGVVVSIIVGLGTVLAWISYCPFVRDVVKERISKQPSTCE
uniref:hypothetical protein n=1 Tax=Pontibacterium sp. TaxID=2036026 RepID=UPI003565EEA2